QICAVIVTIAVVAIAAATIRSSNRLVKALEEVSRLAVDLQQWMVQARQVTDNAQEVLGSIRDAVDPVKRMTERFENLGDRAVRLSEAVLDEVETPVRAAVAFTRGVRTGTAYFFDRLSN